LDEICLTQSAATVPLSYPAILLKFALQETEAKEF
jgi:hypothetical protein